MSKIEIDQIEEGLAKIDGSNIPANTKWSHLNAGGVGDYTYVDTGVGSNFERVMVWDQGGWFWTNKSGFASWLGLSDFVPTNYNNAVPSTVYIADLLAVNVGTYTALISNSSTNKPFVANPGGLISFGAGNNSTRILGARDNSDNLWFQSGDGTGVWRQIASREYMLSQLGNFLPFSGGTMTGSIRYLNNSVVPIVKDMTGTSGGWNRSVVSLEHTGDVLGGLMAYGNAANLHYLHLGIGAGLSHNGAMYKFGQIGLAIGLVGTANPASALDVTGEIRFRSLNTPGFVKTDSNGVLSIDTNTYLTDFTETDPTVPSHVKGITSGDIANWNQAYGWGNHALAGYLTSTSLNNYYQSGDVNIPIKGGNYRVFPRANSASNTFDLDTITDSGFYYQMTNNTNPNTPKNGYWYIENHRYQSGSNDNLTQYAHPYRVQDGKWMRNRFGGTWSNWVEFWHSGNFNPAQYVMISALNATLANYGTLAGTQTWTGQNTYTQAPIVPNGTLAGHTVNLGQLNTILSAYALASAIPTNNNQLTNGAGYITVAALSGYVLQSALNMQLANYVTLGSVQNITATKTFTQSPIVPNATLAGHAVNLGQMQSYVTGLGYTTLSAVQSWVNSQNFATAASIGNGTIIVQGVGAVTGVVTFQLNQSGNAIGSLDLTTSTKNDIQKGVTAESWGDHAQAGYQTAAQVTTAINNSQGTRFINITAPGSTTVTSTRRKTSVNVAAMVTSGNILLNDGQQDGYEIVIASSGEFTVNVTGNVRALDGTAGSISITKNTMFWWSATQNVWIQVM